MGCTTSAAFTEYDLRKSSAIRGDVNSLKSKDAMNLNIRKITMLLWESRNDPAMVEELTSILVKNSNIRHLFEGVEFYLPQLAHMIIHLETMWPKDTLQEFTLIVAQHSLHFALQLNWILLSSMEDYQPEDEMGNLNPKGDSMLFARCASLLHQLERAVVYSSKNDGAEAELEALFNDGKITIDELNSQRIELRHKLAQEICSQEEENDDTIEMSGQLLFKRWSRNSKFSRKDWKSREFRLQYKVLHCYRVRDGALKRAIPLHHTTIVATEHHTHKWYFEVREKKRDRVYKLAAPSEAIRDKWISALQHAAEQPPKYQSLNFKAEGLSPAQRSRYDLFQKEKEFVRSLTNICEELRFAEVPQRKKLLVDLVKKVELARGMYLPLCNSTDPWVNLLATVPEKCKAFSTRERVPCMMAFRVRDDAADVAHKLHVLEAPDDALAVDGAAGGTSADQSAPLSPRSLQIASLWKETEAEPEAAQSPEGSLAEVAEEAEVRVMVKSHDDLRQEVFIMQMIQYLHDIWAVDQLSLQVTPYRILSTSKDTGMIEAIEQANSIHGWKADYREQLGRPVSLSDHFDRAFDKAEEREAAVQRFAKSLAGYSVATYILGIKDRHNGNIMLSEDGRLIHIDFGFVLGMAPGKDKIPHTNFSMERAAFKLTKEMSAVLGGTESKLYGKFKQWCLEGFLSARANSGTLLSLVEITSYQSSFPCFKQPGGGAQRVLRELKQRLMLNLSEKEAKTKFLRLVKAAHHHPGTMIYESFQKKSNGYEPLK